MLAGNYRRTSGHLLFLHGLLLSVLLSACAPRPLRLPAGAGVPFPGYAEAYEAATADCRDVTSLTAELGLSGRAGGARLRGRAIVGAAVPDRIRLEALAPFGPPMFILTARDGRATLLLPRDDRVVDDQPPDAIVEALAGVRVDPATIRAALAGCALPAGQPRSGRLLSEDWLVLDVGEGRSIYLRRAPGGAWRVRGARAPEFTITYDELGPRLPSRITIDARSAGTTDAQVRLSVADVDLNVPLGEEAFDVEIPESAVPITLGELRESRMRNQP